MHTFVLLSIVSLACGAPVAVEAEAPAAVEEEAPAALPYVHDATGDVAEACVHEEIPAVEAAAEEEIAAEAYVHDATGDVAEPYVHEEIPAEDVEIPAVEEEIAAEVYTHEEPVVPAAVAPVTYTVSHPTAGVIPIASYAGVYAGHTLTYPYAVYHTPTGCVNNVGSVVPCA